MNDKFLDYFAIKYKGDFDKVYEAICNKEQFTLQEYNTVMKERKYKSITMMSDKYPIYLKMENCPPIVLFYQGNLDLLETPELPIKYAVSCNNRRYLTTMMPIEKENGEVICDYIVMSESQEDLSLLLDKLRESDIPVKNYEKKKDKEKER